MPLTLKGSEIYSSELEDLVFDAGHEKGDGSEAEGTKAYEGEETQLNTKTNNPLYNPIPRSTRPS